jgi:hypothetical protein
MTIWPGVPLPLPPLVARKNAYRLDASESALIGTGMGVEVEASSRLGEVYLEVYDLDLEDPAAILGFAGEYGVLSGALVYSALSYSSWFSGLLSPGAEIEARDSVLQNDPVLRQSMDPAEPGWELTDITTLESFRFAARVLRDLTNAWRLVNGDARLDVSSHAWELNYPVDDETKRSRFFALSLLGFGLTPLLVRFHPYLGGTPPPLDVEPEEAPTPLASARVNTELANRADVYTEAATSIAFAHLAEFCALELFNHIAGSEVYRQCQNESCRRVFVRQYGRAEHGQSRREGVMYCSSSCAQAAASRNYRRRRRARERN